MQIIPLLHPFLWILLATTKTADKRRRNSKFVIQPPCWYLDGNNIMHHKGTPNNVETLIHKLAQMQGNHVKLVLDGSASGPGGSLAETENIVTQQGAKIKHNKNNGCCHLLEVIHLAQDDMSADDFICHDIQQTMLTLPTQSKNRIHVVTADRELRRRVLSLKPAVKEVVNPGTFWRRYMPRLCGFKKTKE